MTTTSGTKEWRPNNENCIEGCSNDCRYCYAKKNAIRFGRRDPGSWKIIDHNGDYRYGNTFLNPPYSAAKIYAFMQKAYEESQKGAIVVCLVPVSGDRWWIDWALKAQEIRYIKGRVKFVGYDIDGNPVNGSPMFSSCVVIFWPKEPEAKDDMPRIGKTIEQPKKGSVKE